MGFLNLMNPVYLETETNEQVLVLILETLQSQASRYFKRYLIIIKQMRQEDAGCFYEVLDLRKLIRIKKGDYSFTIDMPSKTFAFKSIGYAQNVNFWYEKLAHMCKLECATLEDQYLSKDDYPLLVEKCFSCVEMNFIADPKFYFNLASQSPINVKKVALLYQKLLRERDFELEAKKLNPILILNIVRMFLANFVNSSHLTLLKNMDSSTNSNQAWVIVFSN